MPTRIITSLMIEPWIDGASAAELLPGAGEALIRRLLPRQAEAFAVEALPDDDGRDVFEIESRGGQIVLRGNTGVSVASALNAYLTQYCHADISWDCGNQLDLPDPLPGVTEKIRVHSPHRFRFALNYCTHGYTMAWWDWNRWERELDFLALSGVNLALVTEGQEAVWINTLGQFGCNDADLRQWLVPPTHQPWMFMANMENYGGPLSQSLVERRVKLGQKIVHRMRELGMEPVLQGYYGIVPANFRKIHPEARIHPQGNWCDLKRPDLPEPTHPLFAQVAEAFYREQTKLFGKANFFAGDPFHEGGKPEVVDLPAYGRAIHDAMNGGTWVIQCWRDNPRQTMIDPLDKDRLLVLDLWCEAEENWRLRNHFNGTPWLWCTIHNFGGNVGMGGRLDFVSDGPLQAMRDPAKGRLSGIGALMEGSGMDPVLWKRFFENAWRTDFEPLGPWLEGYARRRYGAAIPAAEQAWKILSETIYNAPQSHMELPVNSVVCARPSLSLDLKARAYVTAQPYYDSAQLMEAWRLLLEAAPRGQSSDGYRYDLADLGRQGLANLGTDCHQMIVAAYRARDVATLRSLSDRMVGLIHDMDELVGTRREFLLGVWLDDARRWGADRQERDHLERVARELNTVWTCTDSIPDYANRQWSGMLRGFYDHRWEMWLNALNDSLAKGVEVNEPAVREEIRDWELDWTRQQSPLPVEPQGDVVAISHRLYQKYWADASQS